MKLVKEQQRKRLYMMLSGAFAIFFTGYPHVWSVYQPYVMEQAGWSQSQASMCFYLALAAFVFGNIIGGRMQDIHNPRLVLEIGGWIFSAGIMLSAFLILPSPVLFYLTYGVMQGFGQGMIYATIISTAQKWFPGRTGFASGIVVTANGLCGFVLAPASKKLLESNGLQYTFLLVGFVIAISWIVSLLFFSTPDAEWRIAAEAEISKENGSRTQESMQKQYTSSEMIKSRKFYYLLATMCFGLMSYFLISPVSQSYQTEIGIPGSVAISAVMIGSIMNAGTRLILPTLSDKWGRISCIRLILVVSVAAMAILGFSQSYLVTIAIIVMYGCYGGIMGSFPSLTSSIFGMEHSGENYGFVMLSIVITTFGAPTIISLITGNGGTMQTVFMTGMVFAVMAFISLCLLKRELEKNSGKSV